MAAAESFTEPSSDECRFDSLSVYRTICLYKPRGPRNVSLPLQYWPCRPYLYAICVAADIRKKEYRRCGYLFIFLFGNIIIHSSVTGENRFQDKLVRTKRIAINQFAYTAALPVVCHNIKIIHTSRKNN